MDQIQTINTLHPSVPESNHRVKMSPSQTDPAPESTQPHCPTCREPSVTGLSLAELFTKLETLEEYVLDVRHILDDVLHEVGFEPALDDD